MPTEAKILWTPSASRVKASHITKFIKYIKNKYNKQLLNIHSSSELYDWSIDEPTEFWDSVWSYCDVLSSKKGKTILSNPHQMPGAKWFPEARLNYAENLLRQRNDQEAIVFRGEDKVTNRLTYAELYDAVSITAQALSKQGVKKGDRVAAFLPNLPDTIIFMLATASLGALWSSCSPDFGSQGVLDRFGQIKPKILIGVDGYYYNGKHIETTGKLREIAESLKSLKKVVVVPYTTPRPKIKSIKQSIHLKDFVKPFQPGQIQFKQVPFNHPLFIMFSSGTTGVPKCIVHGHGGTLLQHLKEHQLHTDIKPKDRFFYFTTCGWMMWNWLVSGLASGATLLLYDGSPTYPKADTLFDFAQKEKITIFGTSAKYIDAINKLGVQPKKTHKLTQLKTITSTGSPLSPESFDYVYTSIKKDVLLSSIAGGTDIISCFVLGDPTLPVHRGEIQRRGFGLSVQVFNDEGNIIVGEKGELVCTKPFPSMPIGFWNDKGDRKYLSAYFSDYKNTWCHGDFIELTKRGTLVIYGRSDAVLNPGGVRIGTAEIYRQVEKLDSVMESLVIGQSWQSDTRVVLFVRLRDGLTLNESLQTEIKRTIRANTTPRHVPEKILQVPDIPRTKSGKIVELAVRNIIHQETIKNIEALANPEALAYFKDRTELKT
ncbi:MAG: acetoacetate--CoA ligase [Betaproteobacteria bacterium TMED22]|nr:MAG: acetoacetate--CoA ligase [Betaproteobacteria bacterium TMED22]